MPERGKHGLSPLTIVNMFLYLQSCAPAVSALSAIVRNLRVTLKKLTRAARLCCSGAADNPCGREHP